MMRFHYVIKLIGRLLRNAIIWRSKHDLSFYHEDDGVWYVDFPDWPFAHHNLVRVEVIASKALLTLSGYGLLTKTYSNLFYGADYDATDFENFQRSVWICPSRCLCRGRHPKYIYVKKK